MMRGLVILACVLVGTAGGAAPVDLHFFWASTCPQCLIMKDFLAALTKEYAELKVVSYEVAFDADNWRLMNDLAEAYGTQATTTPIVFVGNLAVAGVGRVVELRIQEEVERCAQYGCRSPLDRLGPSRRWRLSPIERLVIVLALVGAAALVLQLLSR